MLKICIQSFRFTAVRAESFFVAALSKGTLQLAIACAAFYAQRVVVNTRQRDLALHAESERATPIPLALFPIKAPLASGFTPTTSDGSRALKTLPFLALSFCASAGVSALFFSIHR